MSYKLIREIESGKVVKLLLGVTEVDAYLKFLKQRCRLNTWISYGYDLPCLTEAYARYKMQS
jgi:hypothetical protein